MPWEQQHEVGTMSLSSHTLGQWPVAWVETKAKPSKKVPPNRQMVAVADDRAAPEPR